MTREEILAMELGRELDALVAEKVMGWKTAIMNGFQTYVTDQGAPKPWVDEWNPSTNISAAWEVVEKMKEKNWWIVLSTEGEEWTAFYYWDPNAAFEEAKAKSAPLAICSAALLAVMDT